MTVQPYYRDEATFLNQTPRRYQLRTTIQHWQLRDLVLCPKGMRSSFVYVNQNNVNFFDTNTEQTTPALKDLSFSPTSICSGYGYLAAGGQRSQLAVRSLDTNWTSQVTVGGSINNSMFISNHFGETRLLICNNDETIKIYSLPDLVRLQTIQFPTAVNAAAVSPDGRKLIAVGDSQQVFLYNITPNGDYVKTTTLVAGTDAGFSCAWNQSSEKFAVATQDGYVSVWDIRSTEKLTKLKSMQHPQVKGACRCVKFSPSGSMDLLMYSEHISYINIVDTRNFSEKQTIRVSPPGNDQNISGISFSEDCKKVFVGVENSILEYQVDTMARRCFPQGSIL
ncbi:WD40-repeat-containing domain protein [Gorgonomyces haynaldii]|nr:WD40-repeat-containing domain protein [Gorgonomyces haynaldii]